MLETPESTVLDLIDELLNKGVMATGDVDSRGALGEAGVRVGFQSIRLEIQLRLEDRFDPGVADVLVARAERRCELLQTLRFAVPIEVVIDAG